jgi:hypothetical protein
VEAVDGVWHAKLGVEERVNLLGVAKVRLAGDDVLGALGRLGLDNVTEDEADVGGERVGQELAGELQGSAVSPVVRVTSYGRREGQNWCCRRS